MPPIAQASQLDIETERKPSGPEVTSVSAHLAEFVKRNRFLLVFAALSLFMGVSAGMAQVTTSLYAVGLGCSKTMLTFIAASQSVGVIVMGLPVGMLVERFGPARLFVLGTILSGLMYVIVPFGASPGHLLLCTTAIGFIMPLRFVSLNTVFLHQLTALGASKSGWYRGTHMVGMFLIGPIIAAKVVEGLGYSGSFGLVAIMLGVATVISRFVLRRYAYKPSVLEVINLRRLRAQVGVLLRDRELRKLSLIEFLSQAVNGYFAFFIVVIAISVAHLGAERASSLVSAEGFTYVVALFALGGVVGKLGTKRAYLMSLLLVTGGLAVLGCAASFPSLWLGSLTLGLGLGTLQIENLTRYAQVGQRAGHGRVSGISALAGPSGGMVGNLCGGVVGRFFGLQAVFLFFAGLLIFGCLPLLRQLYGSQLERTFAPVANANEPE